jgi:Ca2+-dependent lipid-binding protein
MSAPNGDVHTLGDARKAPPGSAEESGQKVVTGLTGMYILVACAVSCAWLIGYFELSFVWAFILLAGLFLVWQAKISKIIKRFLACEEVNLYRKRAFRQNETVEWFNFLLNRW